MKFSRFVMPLSKLLNAVRNEIGLKNSFSGLKIFVLAFMKSFSDRCCFFFLDVIEVGILSVGWAFKQSNCVLRLRV